MTIRRLSIERPLVGGSEARGEKDPPAVGRLGGCLDTRRGCSSPESWLTRYVLLDLNAASRGCASDNNGAGTNREGDGRDRAQLRDQAPAARTRVRLEATNARATKSSAQADRICDAARITPERSRSDDHTS